MSAKPRMTGFFDNGTEVAPEGRVSPRSAGPEACCRRRRICQSRRSRGMWHGQVSDHCTGKQEHGDQRHGDSRQSITALYEESERSAIDGLPMLAVIDSEPPAPLSIDEQIGMNERPTIARFDELRRLADLEMPTVRNAPTMPIPSPNRSSGQRRGQSGGR